MAISLFALVGFLVFSGAAAGGGHAAVNESANLTDYHHNITNAEQELEKTLKRNMTDTGYLLFQVGGGWVVDPVWDIAHEGANWGYNNPTQAKWLAKASVPVASFWMAWIFYKWTKPLLRRFE